MRTGDVLSFSKVTPLDVQNDMVYSGVFMEIASLGLLLALGGLGREKFSVFVPQSHVILSLSLSQRRLTGSGSGGAAAGGGSGGVVERLGDS